ncbi:MAG TPA: shikimate dehydrogenase [Actinomycetota bacterium]|nr:shikimate dehydrogenase [Actinomycetota bacterium]
MPPVSGATRVAGIIGWPVNASLSPAIHNAAFSAAGLDWIYVGFPVRPDDVAAALQGMRGLGIAGLNVTMPHKQAVIPHLDGLTPDVERVGAVNTIVADGARLIGTNTDGAGFLRFLERDVGMVPAGLTAVVLGAGGAARGIAAAMSDAGVVVTVTARRSEQADEVAAASGASTVSWDERDRVAAGADLIVNATPVGRDDASAPLPTEAIGEGQTVVDLIYHPEETELVRIAAKRGARAFNGMGMLLHQAALSFEAWTGVDAPFDAMTAAVR